MNSPAAPHKRVAIVGASHDRTKYGNKSLRAHLAQGFEVLPVNPKGGTIEGLPAYRSLAEIPPGPLERVSMYVPPAVGITLLDQIAALKPKEVWFNPGSESEELVSVAAEKGLNVIIACSIVDLGRMPDEFPGE